MKVDEYHARVVADMREDALLQRCRHMARALGLLVYHTHNSQRSEPGFPDLVIVGPRGVLFRELKRQNGRVTDAQQQWLDALQAVGLDAEIWRPTDLITTDRIAHELQALTGRDT